MAAYLKLVLFIILILSLEGCHQTSKSSGILSGLTQTSQGSSSVQPSPTPTPIPTTSPTPLPSASPTPQQQSVQCTTPSQDSVDTSTWKEIFIGTSSQSCNDTSPIAGSRSVPFCNPHLAMAKVTSGQTIITYMDGEYRVDNFKNSSGQKHSFDVPAAGYTNTKFLIVRADKNAKPIILGSVKFSNTWSLYSSSPRIFRTDVSSLQNNPMALWQVVDNNSKLYTNAKRFRHVMVFTNGVRSHSDVSTLSDSSSVGSPESSMTENTATKNFTWTKADAAGTACGDANSGCFVYLRADDTNYNPNSFTYEISQFSAIGSGPGSANYLVLDGINTRFTQANNLNCSVWFEGSSNLVIQNSTFGHVANSDDNSYGLGLWSTNGSVVRNNKIFDSAYWGGSPNSKGLTFMVSGDRAANWACNNEIYYIPGQAGVSSKGGVQNLKIIGNYIHDSDVCIETDHNRTQDGTSYSGGNWQIQQNTFERCNTGVEMTTLQAPTTNPLPDIVINNIFINNFHGIGLEPDTTVGGKIQNNIFLGGSLANSCNSYGTCGSGIYFSNGFGDIKEYSYVLGTLNIKMSNNIYYNINYTHGINRNWTPNFANYTLSQFKSSWSSYSPESRSVYTDPMLDSSYKPLGNSPALNSGIGDFYGLPSVNIGIFLQ